MNTTCIEKKNKETGESTHYHVKTWIFIWGVLNVFIAFLEATDLLWLAVFCYLCGVFVIWKSIERIDVDGTG